MCGSKKSSLESDSPVNKIAPDIIESASPVKTTQAGLETGRIRIRRAWSEVDRGPARKPRSTADYGQLHNKCVD